MKSQLVFTMATVLLTSVAFAKNKQSSTSTVTTSNAATASQPASSSASLDATSEPAAESTASLSNAAPAASKFGLGLSTRSDANAKSVNQDRDATILQVNRLTLSYKVTDVLTVNTRAEVDYNNATTKRIAKSTMMDMWVGAMHTKLATLPGDWNLSGIYRQYLPTGEGSRFVNKRAGMEFLYVFAEKSVGKFDFGVHANPYYFNNTQDYYLTDKGAVQANPDFETDGWVSVGYNITPNLSISHSFGIWGLWYRGVPTDGVVRENTWYNETAIEFHPVKQVTISASVENDAGLKSDNSANFYQDGDTTYRALLAISI